MKGYFDLFGSEGRSCAVIWGTNSLFVFLAILTLICMSVYTWVLTKNTEQKYRGWSFYLGWVSFPLFLIAGELNIL